MDVGISYIFIKIGSYYTIFLNLGLNNKVSVIIINLTKGLKYSVFGTIGHYL